MLFFKQKPAYEMRISDWSSDVCSSDLESDAAGASATDHRFPDRDGIEATGRLGALYHASPALALRAAGYTGFSLPTLNELYRPFNVFPVVTMANSELDLEPLHGLMTGVELTPLRVHALQFLSS